MRLMCMDVAVVRNVAQTILSRYGANAGDIAAHAARQAHRNGDAESANNWGRVGQTIKDLAGKASPGQKLDLIV